MEKTVLYYSIKGGLLNAFWNLVFVAFGFYLLSLINFEKFAFKFADIFLPIVAVIFIVTYGKKAGVILFSMNKQIVFAQEGIEINGIFYDWKSIIFPRVISKEEYTGKYNLKYTEFYLNFTYQQKTVEIKIDDYATSESEVKELLKKYTPKFSTEPIIEDTMTYNPIHNLDQIITLDQYYDLEYEDSEEAIKDVQKLAVKDLEAVKRFCENNLYTQPDKVKFVYYALSEDEDLDKWADFLSDEFSRVYQIGLDKNSVIELSSVINEILVETLDTYPAERVRETLSKGLDHKDIATRLNALEFLEYWIDESVLKNNPSIVSKLRQKLKDAEWKMRWKTSKLLEYNKIAFESLSTMDKLRRFINP